MSQIDGERVKEFLSNGILNFAAYVRDAYDNRLDEEARDAYADAIVVGINNTIAALYEVNVEDNEIIRVLNTVWGIAKGEATDLLIKEKIKAPQRELKEYLILQGMSPDEIREFIKSNRVYAKLRDNPELRAMRRKPEKLYRAVREGV